MNLEDVVNYVLHTPGNTNPNLLRQWLASMDGSTDWEDMPEAPAVPYILFEADTPFLVGGPYTKYWDGTLEYSQDGENWTVWDSGPVQSNNDNQLYFRGSNNTRINGEINDNFFSVFNESLEATAFRVSGNIEALLDYETVLAGEHPVMEAYCFRGLFAGTLITTAPDLPASVLAPYCYSYMFAHSSIQTPPALPATTLAEGCYAHMFEDCDSLIAIPALPATILPEACYSSMFSANDAISFELEQSAETPYAYPIPYHDICTEVGIDATDCMFYYADCPISGDIHLINMGQPEYDLLYSALPIIE